jgi:pimeloyl-ACP methyl ester carboxylesterase
MNAWTPRCGLIRVATAALVAALTLFGCSSPAGRALDPEAERVAYHESDNARTLKSTGVFVGSDGRELAYTQHRRHADTALVYLHGIESHGGWFDHAGDLLADLGDDVFCLDRRGSGINREDRGFVSGHTDSWRRLVDDMHEFIGPLGESYDRVFIVGLSWGGKQALAYGLTYPEECDGLVLITPGLVALVDGSLLDKVDVLLSSPTNPEKAVPIPIEEEMFTTDPHWLGLMSRDPLRLRYASARFFWESHRLDGWIESHVEENVLPMQLFLAGSDRIIHNDAVLELLRRGDAAGLEVHDYEDQTHSVQFDAPERLVADMHAWLLAQPRRRPMGEATP